MLNARFRNAETLRTQSLHPHFSSVCPRFKNSLADQFFTNTQIPACIWFLTKTKQKRGRGAAAFRDRTGEVLFNDARQLGSMVDRVLQAFIDEDTERIVSTFHAWKRGPIVSGKSLAAGSSGEIGNAEALRTRSSCSSICSALSESPRFKSPFTEIAEHCYVLTPGRYVGAEEVEDDGVPFAEKMEGLTRELATQFHESEKLPAAIRDSSTYRSTKLISRMA